MKEYDGVSLIWAQAEIAVRQTRLEPEIPKSKVSGFVPAHWYLLTLHSNVNLERQGLYFPAKKSKNVTRKREKKNLTENTETRIE